MIHDNNWKKPRRFLFQVTASSETRKRSGFVIIEWCNGCHYQHVER